MDEVYVDKLFDAVAKNDLKKISEVIKEDTAKFLFIPLMRNHTSQRYQ